MPNRIRKKKAHKIREKKRKLWLYNDFVEEFGSLSNCSQGTLSKLSKEVVSNLSETVVSLASFNGDQIHAVCTGTVVKNEKCGTSIVTSATLVRSLNIDDGCKVFPGLTIEVSLPNNRSARGWLVHCDLNCNVAVVNISYYPGFRAAHIDDHMQFVSDSKVVALGRCFNTGKLKALYGVVTHDPSRELRKDLMISTCKINMVMNGGPLVDLDGNFIGMNFYSKDKEMTPFLPMDKVYICLVHAGIQWSEIKHGGDSTIERSPCGIQECLMPNVEGISCGERDKNQELSISSTSYAEDFEEEELGQEELWRIFDPNPLPVDDFTKLVRNDLESRSYPMPIKLEGGMRLINTFEEEFVEDSWSKLSKKVASGISRSVVSLASFKGEKRFFACTGIFLDSNVSTSSVLTSASLVRTSGDEYKIADKLKIRVYLPNKQVVDGTLQHYNLSYNIAVVNVSFRCGRTAELHNHRQIEPHMGVLAVGRIFESGKLMATSGIVADKEGILDCKELMVSTCKITKAGIGGPLIDFDVNFIGMNFHGMEETHYLPRCMVQELLRHFERSDADEASYKKPNRWPVPEPRWSYPLSRAPRVPWTISVVNDVECILSPKPTNLSMTM